MRTIWASIACLLVYLLCLSTAAAPAATEEDLGANWSAGRALKLTVRETRLGKLPEELDYGWPFVVSGDCNHIAWVETRSKWLKFERVIFLDGVEVKRYNTDYIEITFGPGGRELMWTVSRPGRPSLLGAVTIGETEVREVEEHKDADGAKARATLKSEYADEYKDFRLREMVISPDRTRCAFVLAKMKRDEVRELVVVMDGVPGPRCVRIGQSAAASASAYPVIFSPDGTRVAYVAKRRGKMVMVVDGVESPEYEWVTDPVFSARGNRLAYHAKRRGRWVAFVDGVEQPENTGALIFSPDGQHVAYVTSDDRKIFVVLDGVPGKQFEAVQYLAFTSDSDHLIYQARNGRKWRVVRDNEEGKQYDEIVKDTLTISPDGKRLAYAARDYKSRYLVVDGQEVKQYDEFLEDGVAFSPDSKRVACLARRYRTWVAWVDGVEAKGEYDGFLSVPPVFDSPDRLHFLAVRGSGHYHEPDVLRVEIEIAQE